MVFLWYDLFSVLPLGSWVHVTHLFVSLWVVDWLNIRCMWELTSVHCSFWAVRKLVIDRTVFITFVVVAIKVSDILGFHYSIFFLRSKLQILVSPNSSLSTKHSMIPWSGLIYIHCDNGQKVLSKLLFFLLSNISHCSLSVIILISTYISEIK